MDPALLDFLVAIVRVEDKRRAWVTAAKGRIAAETGARFVGWTGGGGPDHNRIYDVDTNETLAIVPDTFDDFQVALTENNWLPVDAVTNESYDKFPEPSRPADYPEWLLSSDLDPDVIRPWLAERNES